MFAYDNGVGVDLPVQSDAVRVINFTHSIISHLYGVDLVLAGSNPMACSLAIILLARMQ
jgi:hypothetical protein